MHLTGKILAAALLASVVAGCNTVTATMPDQSFVNTGLTSDGACVSRNVQIFDSALGDELPVTQRFCGGRLQVTR